MRCKLYYTLQMSIIRKKQYLQMTKHFEDDSTFMLFAILTFVELDGISYNWISLNCFCLRNQETNCKFELFFTYK
jgi:hypothetical protein